MNDPLLPPDLAALERRLADRPLVEPPSDLGPRVLAASRGVLRPVPSAPARAIEWRSWAAAAAVILLAINLSMSLAAATRWKFAADIEPGYVQATADGLRALDPALPEAELRRQALLARAGAGLTPSIPLPPHWERTRISEESDRWDVR